jgi:hypothetical protein
MFRIPTQVDYERAVLAKAKADGVKQAMYRTKLGIFAVEKNPVNGQYSIDMAPVDMLVEFDEVACRKVLAKTTNEAGWL